MKIQRTDTRTYIQKIGKYLTLGALITGTSACDALVEDILQQIQDEILEATVGFGVDLTNPNAEYTGKVRVIDQAGEPVVGATMALPDETATSDGEGYLAFQKLKVGEVLTGKVRAQGFMSYPLQLDYSFVGQPNATIQLKPVQATVTFDASAGGSLESGVVGVTFEGGSFVDANGDPYTGKVTVNMASFNADVDLVDKINDDGTITMNPSLTSDQMPKGYFLMSGEGGNVSSALPQSIMTVELEDENGNEIQLDSSKPADIRLGLPSLTRSKPGDVLTLASYDVALGMWKVDGTCTVQIIPSERATGTSALECVGQAKHFSQYTASENYGTPRCVKFKVEFDGALAETIQTAGTRSQKIEYITAAKDANGNWAQPAKDFGLGTDVSQCFIGNQQTYWARITVTFTKSDGTKTPFVSEWVRPNAKVLRSGGEATELCNSCEVYTVRFGGLRADGTATPVPATLKKKRRPE